MEGLSFPNAGMETRIAAVADLYESRKQAASTADVALSSLQRWISGEGMPAFGSLALLAAGKGVSLDWVASGKGEMFLASRKPSKAIDDESDESYAYIPLYDAKISAGHGNWSEGAKVLTRLAFTRYSLRKKGLDPAKLSAVRVDGDSMVGLLDDGDTVMVDHSRNTLEGEGVYVIRLDDHMYAKRLQRQFDGSVHVISENKAYRDMVIPKSYQEEFEIIGRVVWAGGWMV